MTDPFEIAELLVAHALREHADDVAIIAYYGSHATGSASPASDLDMFYIPDDGRAQSLSSQFVLDGRAYDLWPLSWQAAEEIANARSSRPWAVAAALIAEAKVLHYRSREDLGRFDSLKARIAELAKPASRGYMVGHALSAFRTTLFWLGQLRLAAERSDTASARSAARQFTNSAVNCLALLNQTYFTTGWGAHLSQVLELPAKPAGLERMLRDIVGPGAPDEVLSRAGALAKEVRRILSDAQASLAEPSDAKAVFADFYPFVSEHVAKVLSACARTDEMAAGSAAHRLQEELCWLLTKVADGIDVADFNLLGEYAAPYDAAGFPDLLEPASRGDLAELSTRVRELDEKLRQWFTERSVALNVVDTKDELRGFLNAR